MDGLGAKPGPSGHAALGTLILATLAAPLAEWQYSLKAGGVGLNLTAADYVIHLDPWSNPAVEDQASGRAHRPSRNSNASSVRSSGSTSHR